MGPLEDRKVVGGEEIRLLEVAADEKCIEPAVCCDCPPAIFKLGVNLLDQFWKSAEEALLLACCDLQQEGDDHN